MIVYETLNDDKDFANSVLTEVPELTDFRWAVSKEYIDVDVDVNDLLDEYETYSNNKGTIIAIEEPIADDDDGNLVQIIHVIVPNSEVKTHTEIL